jgi:uncharacterized protein YndB with AHSA1/START domain
MKMSNEAENRADRLVVRKLIRATCHEVFQAWTDPESISQWMCPGSCTTAEATLDVRTGGKFRIVMKDGEKAVEHTGEYQVVEPPSRLAFTWISKGTDQLPTLVTVDLKEAGPYCELTLTHERFVRPEAVPRHEKGWTDIVNKLAHHLEKTSLQN